MCGARGAGHTARQRGSAHDLGSNLGVSGALHRRSRTDPRPHYWAYAVLSADSGRSETHSDPLCLGRLSRRMGTRLAVLHISAPSLRRATSHSEDRALVRTWHSARRRRVAHTALSSRAHFPIPPPRSGSTPSFEAAFFLGRSASHSRDTSPALDTCKGRRQQGARRWGIVQAGWSENE
jgi:hypothetical protein